MTSDELTCSNGDCHVSSDTQRWSKASRGQGQKTGYPLYFDQTVEASLDDISVSFPPSTFISATCATPYTSVSIPPQKGSSSKSIGTSSSVVTSNGSSVGPSLQEQHQWDVNAEMGEIHKFLTRSKGLKLRHKKGKSCCNTPKEGIRELQNVPISKLGEHLEEKAAALILSELCYLRHSLGIWRLRASDQRKASQRLHDMNSIARHFFLKHSCRNALNYWTTYLKLSNKAKGIVAAPKNVECLQQGVSFVTQSLELSHLILRILKSWRQKSSMRRVVRCQVVREAWCIWSCFAASATRLSEALELFECLQRTITCRSALHIWRTEAARVGLHLRGEEQLHLAAARHHSFTMKWASLSIWKRGVDIEIFMSYRKVVKRCLALRRWSEYSSVLQHYHKRLREASTSLGMLILRRSLKIWKDSIATSLRMKTLLAVYRAKLLQRGIAEDGWHFHSRFSPHHQKHTLLRALVHHVQNSLKISFTRMGLILQSRRQWVLRWRKLGERNRWKDIANARSAILQWKGSVSYRAAFNTLSAQSWKRAVWWGNHRLARTVLCSLKSMSSLRPYKQAIHSVSQRWYFTRSCTYGLKVWRAIHRSNCVLVVKNEISCLVKQKKYLMEGLRSMKRLVIIAHAKRNIEALTRSMLLVRVFLPWQQLCAANRMQFRSCVAPVLKAWRLMAKNCAEWRDALALRHFGRGRDARLLCALRWWVHRRRIILHRWRKLTALVLPLAARMQTIECWGEKHPQYVSALAVFFPDPSSILLRRLVMDWRHTALQRMHSRRATLRSVAHFYEAQLYSGIQRWQLRRKNCCRHVDLRRQKDSIVAWNYQRLKRKGLRRWILLVKPKAAVRRTKRSWNNMLVDQSYPNDRAEYQVLLVKCFLSWQTEAKLASLHRFLIECGLL